ncbi:MAG: hypothetical protein LC725_09685 [Lentisphaerae bacterium]|nr:hypothetical protein [Lentisphaerota bacterium]
MKLIFTTILWSILANFVFAQTNDSAEVIARKCILAESISMRFKGSENTNVFSDESVKAVLKNISSEIITDDLNNYADIFEAWAKQKAAKVAKESANSISISTNENKRSMLVREFKRVFDKTGPIDRHGAIIRVEMLELADRHYTNAAPYLKRIAEVELPKALGVPTCARAKSHYQNPAAEAWVILKMPERLNEDDKLAWLTGFIENEKKLDAEAKIWAIEAAERMLRKMERETTEAPSLWHSEISD